MLTWWLALSISAWAGEQALSPKQIAHATWTRDLAVLMAGPYDDASLPAVAQALGRLRDPAALDRLMLLAGLADPQVRIAAVQALGWVPGGARPLRALLHTETDAEVRASGWRSLGRSGDASDVPTLMAALVGQGAEAAAAAEGLALLATRREDVSLAVPSLVRATRRPMASVASWSARALMHATDVKLSSAEVADLFAAYEHATDEETRVWLVQPLARQLDAADRRAWVDQVLRAPWRAPKVAMIEGGWVDEVTLSTLRQDDDPWVAAAAQATQPALDDGLQLRRRVVLGTVSADERAGVLQAALRDPDPSTRAGSAVALVVTEPSEAERKALLTAADPVVRELAVKVASLPELAELVRVEQVVTTLRVALLTLAQRADLAAVPTAAALRIDALAREGSFGVRRPAQALATAMGRRSEAWTPALPSEHGLDWADPGASVVDVTTTAGAFRIVLDTNTAPLGAAAFTELAEQGALDGLGFRRTIPAVLAQSGDTRGDGMGGPRWWLPLEVGPQGFDAGSVGLASAGDGLVTGQWFVVPTDQPQLHGAATRIGVVVDGLHVVRRLTADDVVVSVRVLRAEVR